MGDAEPRDRLGRLAVEALAGEADLAGDADHHVADRAQQRGLAGAVRAEQRGDAALGDAERHAVQHMRLAIGRIEVLDLQQRAHTGSPR